MERHELIVGETYTPTDEFLRHMGYNYKDAKLTFMGLTPTGSAKFRVTFKDGKTVPESYGFIYRHLVPTFSTYKQDAVLAKIKYLDDRFKQRKHRNERNSVGLGDNNLQQGESVRYHEQSLPTGSIEDTLRYIRQVQYYLPTPYEIPF